MMKEEVIETIKKAMREKKILWVRACEEDGSIEPREVEPYSFRPKGTYQKFYFYCLLHNGTRNFLVDKIIEAKMTANTFIPRWEGEV